MGAENLARINEGRQKFANGGKISAEADDLGSAFNRRRVVRKRVNLDGNIRDEDVQLNERDSFSTKLSKQFLPSRIPQGFANAGKQISDEKFEELAARRFGGKPAGSGAPLDLPDADIPTEVKRTKGEVSNAVLVDKLIRSFSQQDISNQGGQSKLTSKTNSLNLRPMQVVYSDQDQDLKPRTAKSLGEKVKKALGGPIQKFALGGLAKENKVGFAILDPDQGGADLDASVTRAQIRGAVKGTDAQKKALDKEISWANKKFNVARQGLPEKTSQKFYDTIAQEAANGVGVAANSLSSGLGLGSVSMPEESKQTMAAVIKKSGSQMGVLFEDVLRVMDSKGPFKPAPKGAFWDFKAGLTGGLASTYDKMPSSFVDARTSYGRSNADAAQGKIIGEIAEEYERSATYKNAKKEAKAAPASAVAAQEKRRAKQAAKMAKMRERAGFAKGGPAPSDTVPALLTPGEFVINKKAASTIGAANLNRMNKRGIAGFAKGGPVGVQKFVAGGTVERGLDALGGGDANVRSVAESLYLEALSQGATDQEGLNIAATQLNDYLTKTSSTYQEAIKANEQATAALGESTPEQTRLNAQVKARADAEGQVRTIAARALKLQRKGIGVQKSFQDATRDVTTEQGKSLKTLEELQKSATALVVERKAAKDALRRGYSNIDGPEDPRAGTRSVSSGPNGPDDPLPSADQLNEEIGNISETFSKASGALNSISSAAIGITLVGGTLIESLTGLDDATKKQYQAVLNSISANVALLGQFASLGLEIAGTISVSVLRKRADTAVAAAATKAAAALNSVQPGGGGGRGGSGKFQSVAAGVGGVLVGVAALKIAIDAFNAAFVAGQTSIRDAANKAADKELELVSAGKGGNEEKFVAERRKAAEADLRIQTRNKDDSGRKQAAGVTGLIAGLAAVAVAVNVIPVAGQAASIALIGLTAALAAGAAAIAVYNEFFATSASRLQENLTLAGNAAEGYAKTQFRAVKSAQELGSALKEAAEAGASTSQQIQILAAATDRSVSEYTAGTQRLEKARNEEAKLRKNLIEDGVLTAAGNESVDAKGDDDAQDMLKSLEELQTKREAAEKANLDLIRKSTAEAATFRTLAQKSVSEGLKDISKLGPAALANISSFDDLAAQTPGLAEAFNKAKAKIQELNKLELDQQLSGETDPAVREALTAKANAQTRQSLAELDTESQKLILSEQKLAKSALLTDQAQRQQALTLSRVNKNLSAFNLLLAQSSKLKNIFGAIDDAGATEFGAVQFDTSIFDVTFKQLNDQAIARINQLGKGTIGKDADGFAKNIRDVKSITKNLPSVFLDFQRDNDGKIIDIPELKKNLTEQIASSIPGGLDGLGGDLRAIIEKNADKAVEGGIKGSLNFEDQKKLQEELEAAIEGQIAVFKRAVELQNQFLGKLAQINSKIVAAQEAVINAQAKISDVFERNADRLANASENPRSRQEREKGRTRTANLALGADARNAGARAGDVKSTAKAFKNLNKEAERLRKEQRKLIEGGKATTKVDSDNSIKSAKFGKEANDAAKGAARAKAELERLADQSARAADVEKDLTKLREKRSELESLQESVAFGSDDQRQEIFKGFRLLQQAFNQGGIQGATGDQRAAIGSALDSISNQMITFEGQQVTGKELKQIFAARETGRLGLGGLNNFIDNLRKAENPLLGELKEIAETELTASAALAGIATQELITLKSIDTTLKATFQSELERAQGQAEAELGANEAAQQGGLDNNAENLLALTDRITEQTRVVAEQTKLMTKLSEDTLTAINNLNTAQESKREKEEKNKNAVTRSNGGLVYMNKGGVVPNSAPTPDGMEDIFKPKGTDTVPAVLEEGEFVIKKSSVDKIGKDKLQQMNNGGVAYRSEGSKDKEKKFDWEKYRNTIGPISAIREAQAGGIGTSKIKEANIRAKEGSLQNERTLDEAEFFSIPRTQKEREKFEEREFLAGFTGDGYQENLSKNVQTANTFTGGAQGAPLIEGTAAIVPGLFGKDAKPKPDENFLSGMAKIENVTGRPSRTTGGAEALNRTRNLEQEALKKLPIATGKFMDKDVKTGGVDKFGQTRRRGQRPASAKEIEEGKVRREKIAQDSIDLSMAIRQGYKPSLKGTGQTDDPILNPARKPKNADETLSQGVIGPEEFLDRKSQQRRDEQFAFSAKDYRDSELKIESEAIFKLGTKKQKDELREKLGEKEYEERLEKWYRDNNSSPGLEDYDKELKRKNAAFRQQQEERKKLREKNAETVSDQEAKDKAKEDWDKITKEAEIEAQKKFAEDKIANESPADRKLREEQERLLRVENREKDRKAQAEAVTKANAQKAQGLKLEQEAEKSRYEKEYYSLAGISEDGIYQEIHSEQEAPPNVEADAKMYAEQEFQKRIRLDAGTRRKNRQNFIDAKKTGFEWFDTNPDGDIDSFLADELKYYESSKSTGYRGDIEEWRNDGRPTVIDILRQKKQRKAERQAEDEAAEGPAAAQAAANPLLDQFETGTAGGAMLEGMPDIPSGSNFTGANEGDAERAAALAGHKPVLEQYGPARAGSAWAREHFGGAAPPKSASTAAGRKKARLAGVKSDIQAKKQEQEAKNRQSKEDRDPVDAERRQKYNSLLRRNGPKIAARYAKKFGLDVSNQQRAQSGQQQGKNGIPSDKQGVLKFILGLLKSQGIDVRELAPRFNNGGKAVDNIPAMLTAGEYVVDEEATKKIGVKNLEKMNATGEIPQKFAKGGVVGGMKTSYLQKGGNAGGSMGPLEINTGPFGEVLDKFSAAFGSKLDNMVGQFDFIAGAVDNLATVINNGMKVSHSFSGDMKMTFSMSEEQTTNIVNAVGDAMTPKMEEIIKREVDQRFNKNSFKAGG